MARRTTPCRLFVYLASESPVAVVLRRGPTAWTRLSLWNTETDTFQHGQWMKNRVYEHRSDVSPDGSLFTYFAFGSSFDTEPARDSWVAISRPPWFTALALWFVGSTYYTGGFFHENRRLWLGFDTELPDQGELPADFRVSNDSPPCVDRTREWTDRTVSLSRLIRAGWGPVEGSDGQRWEHRHPSQSQTLVLSVPTHGQSGSREYSLQREDGESFALGNATWADWDHGGRLVFANGGRIESWDETCGRQVIADFNSQSPEPEPAPDWANVWP